MTTMLSEWSWRRWCVDFTWRLSLVPFGGRDKGRLRRGQARKRRPLHIAEIHNEPTKIKLSRIKNWYTCSIINSKMNSNYSFQILQIYPYYAKGRVSCCVPSLWLILSRARKARQFLEFAETLQARNWNFEKKIEDFCQSLLSSFLLLVRSNHFNDSIWLRGYGWFVGSTVA